MVRGAPHTAALCVLTDYSRRRNEIKGMAKMSSDSGTDSQDGNFQNNYVFRLISLEVPSGTERVRVYVVLRGSVLCPFS